MQWGEMTMSILRLLVGLLAGLGYLALAAGMVLFLLLVVLVFGGILWHFSPFAALIFGAMGIQLSYWAFGHVE